MPKPKKKTLPKNNGAPPNAANRATVRADSRWNPGASGVRASRSPGAGRIRGSR